jgi:hypothetical protein
VLAIFSYSSIEPVISSEFSAALLLISLLLILATTAYSLSILLKNYCGSTCWVVGLDIFMDELEISSSVYA